MKNIFSSIIVKKGLVTLFLIFIYVLGSRLSLPFVNVNSRDFLGGSTAYLAFSTAISGGNLRSLSLLSVGLSPWMSATLLWQMFSLSKRLGISSLSIEVQDRRKMYLTLFISIIQSLAISLNLPIQASLSPIVITFMNTLLLIAGTFFLVWLSDINASNGLGGPMVILLSSMVLTIPQDMIETFKVIHVSYITILLLVLMGILFTYIVSILYRARYRLPIHKVGLHSRFKRYSYFEIMLNPAGGMPYMYVMTFMSLPTYVLLLLHAIFPENPIYMELSGQYKMGEPLWIYLYIVILFIFSIAFAFVNISGDQIADRMKKSGEYIYGVYPGEETSRFINGLVFRFSIVGGIINVVMAGLPMLLVLSDEKLLRVAMIPGLFLMLNGMIFNVKDEVKALRMNETYKPLI